MADRLTFVYLERCAVSRDAGAVTAADSRGTVHIPAASVSTIMLGPGTTITHRAMELLGDAGATVVWVGEGGVRYYAHGRPLTHSSSLLSAQAEAVSNKRSRMAVAREMYSMRFPGEDVSHLTMQQLRGREGARVRSVYRRCSKETGVRWDGRLYDPENFGSGDTVNQALSAANSCLYGLVHSVIVSLGCSPGLGFVHTGHERSFVYDVADLYKAETSIPVAFEIAASGKGDVGRAARHMMRDAMYSSHILERCVKDIGSLLLGKQSEEEMPDAVMLWDGNNGEVAGGISYGCDMNDSNRLV
ncbi:type I-E CRISPR-associated endonuclease Cas1e [Methanomassiliicoccales archaeon LGM-DZ1]|nr:type I-E CRISPR-associated endonuclease Cas1e [Methanomassiliicoccales archaeon LGM-DZ1]